MASAHRPMLDFMIAGAQKCGTTALFHYLQQHPEIVLASQKEVHLFDSPEYCSSWSPEQIDERYRPFFQHDVSTTNVSRDQRSSPALMRGEATPSYLFFPEIAAALRRYNPNLKLIVILRDPVARGISHYYMMKNKGHERLPLWLALLAEPWRLRRCGDRRSPDSAWRRHSYRRRGLYRSQLRNLHRSFNKSQVLVIRTEELARRHDKVLARVFRFLGVSEQSAIEAKTVFAGDWGGRRHPVVSWLLRLSYLPQRLWRRPTD